MSSVKRHFLLKTPQNVAMSELLLKQDHEELMELSAESTSGSPV